MKNFKYWTAMFPNHEDTSFGSIMIKEKIPSAFLNRCAVFEVLRVDEHETLIAEKDNEIGYLIQTLADTEIHMKFRKEQWDLADQRLADAITKIENLEDLYNRKHERVEDQSKEIAMLKVLRDHVPTFDALAKQEFTEAFEAETAELLRQLAFAHKQTEEYKVAIIEMHEKDLITNGQCTSWSKRYTELEEELEEAKFDSYIEARLNLDTPLEITYLKKIITKLTEQRNEWIEVWIDVGGDQGRTAQELIDQQNKELNDI